MQYRELFHHWNHTSFRMQLLLSILGGSINHVMSSLKQLSRTFPPMRQILHPQGVMLKIHYSCLENGLRLLHPFMLYVTEELWQRLPYPKNSTRPESIMICDYPSVTEEWTNEAVENEMDLIVSAVKSLRSLAKESRERRPGYVLLRNNAVAETINKHKLEIVTLANLSSLTVINDNDAAPIGYAVSVVNENLLSISSFKEPFQFNQVFTGFNDANPICFELLRACLVENLNYVLCFQIH